MRWLAATICLLAVVAAVAAWVYVRDWHSARPDAAGRASALIYGKRAFCCGEGRRRCGSCRVEVLDTDGARHWRLRVTRPVGTRCFWIDLDTFGPGADAGFTGIRPVACVGA
jgi:hypothetical protein